MFFPLLSMLAVGLAWRWLVEAEWHGPTAKIEILYIRLVPVNF
jgi:hypothetical protein